MLQLEKQNRIYYALRIAAAMCFIGHGAFGIITKEIWCNYFGVFSIGHDMAYRLMPVVGIIDILCGLVLLIYPLRVVLVWLVIWGTITASLRPLSGEPFAEMIERAGNFGAPLALLILTSSGKNIFGNLFKKATIPQQIDVDTWKRLTFCLQIVVALLLVGHGWLNLLNKKGLLAQYASLGFHNPNNVAASLGIFEIMAALIVLAKPLKPLLILFFIWKMSTELFYPHYEIFEWIERGGSYGAILALIFTLETVPSFRSKQLQISID